MNAYECDFPNIFIITFQVCTPAVLKGMLVNLHKPEIIENDITNK